jgi:hypothetical protein
VAFNFSHQETLNLLCKLIEEAAPYPSKPPWMGSAGGLKGEVLGVGSIDQGAGTDTRSFISGICHDDWMKKVEVAVMSIGDWLRRTS